MTSNHIITLDIFGIRMGVQFLMVILLFIIISSKGTLYRINYESIIYISYVFLLFIMDVAMEIGYKKIVASLLMFMSIFIILKLNFFEIKSFLLIFNNVNLIFSIFTLIFFVFFITGWIENICLISNCEGFLNIRYLINYDSIIIFDEYQFPRFTGYLIQSSLIPAYFLFPLALALSVSKISKVKIFIILSFVIIGLGGSGIFSLIVAVIFYFIIDKLPKLLILTLPFIIFILISFLTYLVYSTAFGEVLSSNSTYIFGQELRYVRERMLSGIARILIIGDLYHEVFESLPFGRGSDNVGKFGSLILTSGLKMGFGGMLIMIIIYYKLFEIIYINLKINSGNKSVVFGLSLLYSLLIQSLSYNDYGFSTYYGFIMFFLTSSLLNSRKRAVIK